MACRVYKLGIHVEHAGYLNQLLVYLKLVCVCILCVDQLVYISILLYFLSKDSVPHQKLIEELTATCLNPHILRWILSYLSNRSQYVVLNGEKSTTDVILSGIPQRSVLEPLLFVIYINDAAHKPLSTGSVMNLYADDILFYRITTSSLDYVRVTLTSLLAGWKL